MPEEDERASEVKHAREVLQIILVTRDQPTIILEPCEQPLDLPSVTIASQEASILRPVRAVATMRRDHHHTGLCQFSIKLVRDVGIVANQALDRFFHKNLCKGLHHQHHFMWRGAFCANGDRKTMAVCNRHDFRSFSSLGFAHAGAPFFAGAKLPSMKASSRSNPPRLRRSSASASRTKGARDRLCVVVVQESRSPGTPIGRQLDPSRRRHTSKGYLHWGHNSTRQPSPKLGGAFRPE